MSGDVMALWKRATKALVVARSVLELDSNAAASRAYYAAFYAVSALFLLRGDTFTKHSAVEAAVHRDLVKPGIWDQTLGKGYSLLHNLRNTGDYGCAQNVPSDKARQAVETASRILKAVTDMRPEAFEGNVEL